MKSNVIMASSSNLKSLGGKASSGNPKKKREKKSTRRASVSMCDLRNQAWPVITKNTDKKLSKSIVMTNMPVSLECSKPDVKVPKPMSVDEGLDLLDKEDSADYLEHLLESFVKVVNKNTNNKNRRLTTDDLKPGEVEAMEALQKMVRRLSQDDAKPFQDELNASIHDKILLGKDEGNNNNDSDLMDSSTWEDNPVIIQEKRMSNSFSRDQPIPQLSSSTRTLKASNESNVALGMLANKYMPRRTSISSVNAVDEKSTDNNVANKFIPKRHSDIDLKGPKPFHIREVGFDSDERKREDSEDSFHTTVFDRNNTCSSSMLSISADDGTFNGPAPIYEQTKVERSDTFDSLSPKKKKFGRSDINNTMAPNSTSQFLSSEFHHNDEEGLLRNTKDIGLPLLDRDQSAASKGMSATSVDAIASLDSAREGSISTSCTMPQKQMKASKVSSAPLNRKFHRNNTTDTDCAVVDIHDELDSFDQASHQSGQTFSANGFANNRPPRRHSTSSSHSCANDHLRMRRNSFSSLFTAQMSLDGLDGPPLKDDCGDILFEGSEYLSISLLCNIYSKLRELSILGHASVKHIDIDVNSHQSLARKKEMIRLGMLKEDSEDSYLDNTKTAGAIVRWVLDEYELLESSSNFYNGFGKADNAAHMYDASLLSDFKTWVEESKVKQLDEVTEQVIKELREECSKRKIIAKEHLSNDSLATMEEQASVKRSVAKRRCSLTEKSMSFKDATWLKQEQALIADHFGIRGGKPTNRLSDSGTRKESRMISQGVLTESMIERTLEKSHDYFEEGSSLRNLLDCGLEVVWFSDRHPDDIHYCICVNRATSTVTVVFRGQEGVFSLMKDSSMSSFKNPILHEDYEGNSEQINLRAAVADEMMRIRRDTKMNIIDEVKAKVEKIGKELTGGMYHLSVTGHSLGAGYAAVAGFYLSSDTTLDLASAVRVFTFASARVGCEAFQKGYKHLEETGRLQHARFTNSNEVVSFLPTADTYHHVGMQINLHKANSAGRQRTRQSLDVSYSSVGSRLGDVLHFIQHCLWSGKSARISEYQHRIHFAREYRLALSDGVLRFDKKRNHLKTLNDYYLMKLRLVEYMGFEKKKSQMPSFLGFFFVSCLISFEIALLFKFVASW